MTKLTAADLDAIRYLPAIRSRHAEVYGYRELSAETKAALRPIVAVGRNGQVADADRVLEKVTSDIGKCFLDINDTPNQECDGHQKLLDPDNNFKAWRDFAKKSGDAVPLALLRPGVPNRAFVQQALAIEADYGVIVVRSKNVRNDLPALQSILSAVKDVDRLLIVLDMGYVRDAVGPKAEEARRAITALRSSDADARIAVLGTSFPRAVNQFGDEKGTIDIQERELNFRLGGHDVAIYGDHAAIYSEFFEPQISTFVPRIDYCTNDQWIYRRHRRDDGSYIKAAKEILGLPDWDAAFASKSWGASVIEQTSKCVGVPPKGFGAPANWIAARVNMHIERQHALSLKVTSSDEEEWDEPDPNYGDDDDEPDEG